MSAIRPKYANCKEAKKEFLQLIRASRADQDAESAAAMKRLKHFGKTFDPSQIYDESWWTTNLGSVALPWVVRSAFDDVFSWSIPSREALELIHKFAKDTTIDEYLAGSGYWAFLLEQMGLTVRASDLGQPSRHAVSRGKTFHNVIYEDIADARPRKGSTIMLSWIPHYNRCAEKFLRRMGVGQRLIYIADKRVCAGEDTEKILKEKFKCRRKFPLPHCARGDDFMWLYEKVK